jgi:dynein heavy chain
VFFLYNVQIHFLVHFSCGLLFAGIDNDVKRILKEAETTRFIKPACNKEGLYDILEQIQERLSVCKKSLNDFLDAKRRIFPRFYFTSEADLLDILSNGSTPRRIAHHVGKVFLATKTLTMHDPEDLKQKNPSEDVLVVDPKRPFVTDVVTSVGSERFMLTTPFQLLNKVEEYMQVVQNNMTSTLETLLNGSVARYALCTMDAVRTVGRVEWLMERYDTKGKSFFF